MSGSTSLNGFCPKNDEFAFLKAIGGIRISHLCRQRGATRKIEGVNHFRRHATSGLPCRDTSYVIFLSLTLTSLERHHALMPRIRRLLPRVAEQTA
ncbi:hypothetical protein [Paradevosia shaoguanensis]|uniref:hypothetical protein n=1 Tax=Paradevosia shaoguanensis TaxID=1335043 RepID=UPI003C71DEFC